MQYFALAAIFGLAAAKAVNFSGFVSSDCSSNQDVNEQVTENLCQGSSSAGFNSFQVFPAGFDVAGCEFVTYLDAGCSQVATAIQVENSASGCFSTVDSSTGQAATAFSYKLTC